MCFLGLASEGDDIASYHQWAKGIKVAIIDIADCNKRNKGITQMKDDRDATYLNGGVSCHPVHDCGLKTRLSDHGVFCASILVGRNLKVNLMEMCQGITRGVVPLSKLYTFPLGCPHCEIKYEYMVRAIHQATRKGVHVISMSLGKRRLHDLITRESDIVGRATLEATRRGVLTCLSVGNNGHENRTINYGMPWVMNVGACTIGKVLTTEIVVATLQLVEGIDVKEKFPYQGGSINVIDKIEGYSINLYEDLDFHPFRMDENSRDKDVVVYTAYEEGCVVLDSGKDSVKYHRRKTQIADFPLAAIRKEDTNRLWHWFNKLGKDMHVKICTSKFKDDPRGIFVPEFSSRGPSLTYPEIVSPDVVAPGVNIVGAAPYNDPINSKKACKPLYSQQTMSETSMAAPHVAGCAALVMHHNLNWSAYAVKSALMTTARSLAGVSYPATSSHSVVVLCSP